MARKNVSPEKMFEQRLEREGTINEFRRICTNITMDGESLPAAKKRAMEIMGYECPEVELALYEQWQEDSEFEDNRELSSLDEACRGLPLNANPAVELDWVRIHPAIRRCAMETDKTKQIVITRDDVLSSQAGVAPSVGAVNMLMHAVNAPSKFFDQLLSEYRKRVDNEEGNKTNRADLGIEEIRRYLGQLKTRKKGKK